MIGVNLYIAGLSLRSAERLMNHHFAVGQRLTLSLGARRQQEGGHAGGHTNTDGGYIAANELHCIVNRHAGGNRPAGAVDIQVDILIRILSFQINQLSDNKGGCHIVDFIGQHNDTVVQQTGKNVIAAFSPAGLFHYIRD